MISRSCAGTTTWPLGEVLTIGMAMVPWFNYIVISTTSVFKLNHDLYRCNDESLTLCGNGRPAPPMNVTRQRGAHIARRAGVIERPLGEAPKSPFRFPRKLRLRTSDGWTVETT